MALPASPSVLSLSRSLSRCLSPSRSPVLCLFRSSSFSPERFQSALRPFSASTLHTLFRRSRDAVTARAFSQPPLAGESLPSSVVAGASRRSKWWSSISGACSARDIQTCPRVCTGFSISSFDQVRGIRDFGELLYLRCSISFSFCLSFFL